MEKEKIVDTHTHLYLPEFEPSPADAVRRALDSGIGHMIFPNVGLNTIGPMRRLHSEFPTDTSMAIGLHPTETGENWEEDLAVIMAELEANQNDYIAVGEVGMDLYWDKTYRAQQMKALEIQLEAAHRSGLPVIIHCREALDETLEVMEGIRGIRAVFHSFGGNEKDVDRIRGRLNDDIYFGINGKIGRAHV